MHDPAMPKLQSASSPEARSAQPDPLPTGHGASPVGRLARQPLCALANQAAPPPPPPGPSRPCWPLPAGRIAAGWEGASARQRAAQGEPLAPMPQDRLSRVRSAASWPALAWDAGGGRADGRRVCVPGGGVRPLGTHARGRGRSQPLGGPGEGKPPSSCGPCPGLPGATSTGARGSWTRATGSITLQPHAAETHSMLSAGDVVRNVEVDGKAVHL